jgi:hypothetical protein
MKKDSAHLRPEITAVKITAEISKEEHFQNKVLRPIIKMKHDLLMAHFTNYVASKKIRWQELTDVRKIDFIESVFTRDLSFRSEMRGLVISHFSKGEYDQYAKIARGSKKRINTIIKQRIISNLDALNL